MRYCAGMMSVARYCAASFNVARRTRMMLFTLMERPTRPIRTSRFWAWAFTGLVVVVALRMVRELLTV